jgi:hypothetical protein
MGQGKSTKGKKSQKARQKTPLFQSSDFTYQDIGGKVSSNLIETIFEQNLVKIANEQAEKYAQGLLERDEEGLSNNTNIDAFLFASTEAREEFTTILSETSSHFNTVGKSVPKWKVHANAAKFERHLNEKYGRLRPFITQYPQIETQLRSFQRKYSRGEFSPLRQGPPPIDKKASIILLVIMHRNGARMETIILTGLFFVVGLQPWALVVLVAIGYFLRQRRKKQKVNGWLGDDVKTTEAYYANTVGDTESNDTEQKAKYNKLLQPVGDSLESLDLKEDDMSGAYDTIIVGSGPSTLYSAALLARTGRAVLVLSPENDASGCVAIGEDGIPFDIQSNNIAHTSAQQRILAPALCSKSDAQGGIRFAQIGTELDGFTSDILSIPGMGVDNYKDSSPFIIRGGGTMSIAQDAAALLGDAWPNEEDFGNSCSAAYLSLCSGINASGKDFYQTKLLSSKVNVRNKATTYQEASIRYASGFLDKALPFNPHIRSLMAGIGMRGENIPPSKTSMAAHVTNISACLSPEGFTYPVGGPRALCHALATVVEQNGGKIVRGANVKEFLFHDRSQGEELNANRDDKNNQSIEKPRCHGVKLENGQGISVGENEESCVVSMLGFIQTFIFKMNDEIRTKYGLPIGLPALSERRPVLKILFYIDGDSDELSLTGADWYRLPNASLPFDEKNLETGEVTPGPIGMDDDETDNPEVQPGGEENDEIIENESRDKRTKQVKKKSRRVGFIPGSSWMKVSFPSAKDPSWKERYGGVTTCVVTVEAGTSFAQMFDLNPRIYSTPKVSLSEKSKLLEKVQEDVIRNFPQLKDKIKLRQMVGPIREGLSHNPQRFAAKGIRPITPYPGLLVGGSDLTVGDSFSASIVGGWMVANAVLDYNFIDLMFLEKNITSDIAQYLKVERKNGSDEEDLAVPLNNKN